MIFPRLRSQGLALARRFCAVSKAEVATPKRGQEVEQFLVWARYAGKRATNVAGWMLRGRVTLPMPFVVVAAYSLNANVQSTLGVSEDFFTGSFVTDKDPDAIAEFYQAEDLLKIIAVFPFLFNVFMDKVQPDGEDATEESALLNPSETHFNMKWLGMEVSFEIIEREEEGEDGESHLQSFIRHERFIDWVPLLADYGVKIMLWDQTWKYGFRALEDGKYEVFHHGVSFLGPWPVRLIVMLHQRYVLWACKNFINGDSFGTEDLDAQQEQMANIPLWKCKQFLAVLRGEKEKSLEAQKNEENPDSAAIAKAEEELEKLKKLEEKEMSSMSLAKRPSIASSFAIVGAKSRMVVSDKEMQDALESAHKDAKTNQAVNTAIKELGQDDDLNWELRRIKTSRIMKTNTQRLIKRESQKGTSFGEKKADDEKALKEKKDEEAFQELQNAVSRRIKEVSQQNKKVE